MINYLRVIILSLAINSLIVAAEEKTENESIFVYCESNYNVSFSKFKSQHKSQLRDAQVKWKVKGNKKASYANINQDTEKELLKNKADRYILACGINELWDEKENKPTELNLPVFKSLVGEVIQKLKAADKKIMLCSPHQILAGKNDIANRRIAEASAILKTLAEEQGVTFCDFYEAFKQINEAGDAGDRNKGLSTKDGYKPNDAGNEAIIASIAQALALKSSSSTSKKGGSAKIANTNRKPEKGDVIVLAGPEQIRHLAQPLSIQIRAHYKEEMSVAAPRVVGVFFGKDFFSESAIFIDVIETAKPTVFFLYPGEKILGDKEFFETLENGVFKKQLKSRIELVRSKINCPVFVCTPLVWKEDDAANLTVVDGDNFKACQLWADLTKEAASEMGCPVVDMHKDCLDYIDKHGAANSHFAGRRATWKGQTTWSDVDYVVHATELVQNAISKAINYPFESKAK